MRRSTRTLAVMLAATALVAAACGDDDGGGAADTTAAAATSAAATTASGGSTPAAAGVIRFVPLEPGPVTFAALDKGDIQIAAVFTTQGAIAENDLVVLDDDKGLQPVQNMVVVGREDVLADDMAAALAPVMEALTTAEITELNRQVDSEKQDPADVAKAWLESKDLLGKGPAVSGSVTVGSANFSEQEIVASMVSQVLASNGADVSEKFGIGSREVVAPALEKGDIDLYVEYVGAYLNYLGGTPSGDLDASLASLRELAGAKSIRVLDPAPADDKDGLAVTQETAAKYKLAKISDLAAVTDTLTFGGPPECPERDFCMLGYEKVYGLNFQQ
jgi:osmoprotectant transport system substrate-binding protein